MPLITYTLEKLHNENWYCVKINREGSDDLHNFRTWCRANCAWDEWVEFNRNWWFKQGKDATAFKLRWA